MKRDELRRDVDVRRRTGRDGAERTGLAVTAWRSESRSSFQAPRSTRNGSRTTRAPRIAGWAVRLGQTGVSRQSESSPPTGP